VRERLSLLRQPALSKTRGRVIRSYAEPPHITISETVNQMIVHHADRLHVRVNHRGSDEAESATNEVFAERVGLARRGGDLAQRRPPVLARPAVDELPAIRVETSVFFRTARNARAFFTAAAIFIRFLMIPGLAVSLSIRESE
jgi:hypothetical protein